MEIRKVNNEIVVDKPQRISQHGYLEMLKEYIQKAGYVFRNGRFSNHKDSSKEIHLDAYNLFKYFKPYINMEAYQIIENLEQGRRLLNRNQCSESELMRFLDKVRKVAERNEKRNKQDPYNQYNVFINFEYTKAFSKYLTFKFDSWEDEITNKHFKNVLSMHFEKGFAESFSRERVVSNVKCEEIILNINEYGFATFSSEELIGHIKPVNYNKIEGYKYLRSDLTPFDMKLNIVEKVMLHYRRAFGNNKEWYKIIDKIYTNTIIPLKTEINQQFANKESSECKRLMRMIEVLNAKIKVYDDNEETKVGYEQDVIKHNNTCTED